MNFIYDNDLTYRNKFLDSINKNNSNKNPKINLLNQPKPNPLNQFKSPNQGKKEIKDLKDLKELTDLNVLKDDLLLHSSQSNTDKEKYKEKYNKFNEYTLKQNYRYKNYINFVNNAEIKDLKDNKYESSYLANANDFNIKEATQINNNRIIKFEKKDAEIYNCIDNNKVTISQPKFQIDKWGKFYEK